MTASVKLVASVEKILKVSMSFACSLFVANELNI